MSERYTDTSDEDSSSYLTSSSDESTKLSSYAVKRFKTSKDHHEKVVIDESELNFDSMLRAQYKWVIKDFSERCVSLKLGDKIESPAFEIGFNNELKFQLLLYPKGSNEHNKNYLVIFIVLLSSKESKIKMNLKYNFINNRHKEVPDNHEITVDNGIVLGERFGYKRLVKTDSVLKNNGYMDNDTLILSCDIDATLNKSNGSKIKVVNDLEEIFVASLYTDVTLEVESKQFKAHMCILAARSSVFSAMFNHNMKEKNEKTVKIPDITPDVMRELLRFIYTGEVKNLDELAKDLLAAADKYDFQDLKKMCENALINNLSTSNAVDMLNFAELHSSTKLKEHVLNFCVNHLKEIVNTSSFKAMGTKQSPLLAQILYKVAAYKY